MRLSACVQYVIIIPTSSQKAAPINVFTFEANVIYMYMLFCKILLPKDTKFVILIILMNSLINVGNHSKFCDPQALPAGPYKTINEL